MAVLAARSDAETGLPSHERSPQSKGKLPLAEIELGYGRPHGLRHGISGRTSRCYGSVASTRQELRRSAFSRMMDSASARISRTRGSTISYRL